MHVKDIDETIHNEKEKRLIVAIRLYKKELEPTDENIKAVWEDLFLYDIDKLVKVTHYKPVRTAMKNYDLDTCVHKLAMLRRKHERTLKKLVRKLGYGVKMVGVKEKRTAQYAVFTKGEFEVGNYDYILNYIEKIIDKKQYEKNKKK
ncbi:MAG: hypothetical protein LUF92_03680 [Clostridiales bacterium]|nr:hypothetical protein [Clostridiales bacterium]